MPPDKTAESQLPHPQVSNSPTVADVRQSWGTVADLAQAKPTVKDIALIDPDELPE